MAFPVVLGCWKWGTSSFWRRTRTRSNSTLYSSIYGNSKKKLPSHTQQWASNSPNWDPVKTDYKAAVLFKSKGRPQFVSTEIQPPSLERMEATLRYWRRSLVQNIHYGEKQFKEVRQRKQLLCIIKRSWIILEPQKPREQPQWLEEWYKWETKNKKKMQKKKKGPLLKSGKCHKSRGGSIKCND